MFQNLNFISGRVFRDFNFATFWSDSPTGAPFESVSEEYIVNVIHQSYASERDPPEPYFYSILPFTLSAPCCGAFVRSNPGLPITERDYYLSKLFQFLYIPLIESAPGTYWAHDEIASQLSEFLDQLPEPMVLELSRFDWSGFYADTWFYEPAEVVQRLPQHLPQDIIGASRPRKHGFDADMENHCKVSTVVRRYPDWKKNLTQICAELDDLGVPYPDQWDGWGDAIATGKQERVIKAIEYRMMMVKKRSGNAPRS